MARVYVNKWELADGDVDVPLNYQLADVQNIESRMTNFSLSAKLPPTARNRALLAYGEQLSGVSYYPYAKIPARLVEDGNELIGSEGYMVVNKFNSTDGFDVSFYSGTYDIFEALKNIRLQDLVFSDPIWNETTIISDNDPSGKNIWWPVVNYLRMPEGYWDENIGGPFGEVDMRLFYPAIKLQHILDLIEALIGFDMSALSLASESTLVVSRKSNDAVEAQLMYGSASQPGTQNMGAVPPDDNFYHPYSVFSNYNNQFQGIGSPLFYAYYKVNIAGKYKLKLTCNIRNTGSAGTHLERIEFSGVFADGTTIPFVYDGFFSQWETVPFGGTWTPFIIETDFVDCSVNDKITIAVHAVSTDDYGNTGITAMQLRDAQLTVSAVEEIENTSFGYTFPIGINLPDYTAWDFVKAICQIKQFIPVPDYINRTVAFLNYQDWYIKSKAGIYYDWSDKLDLSADQEVEYALNFAQRNWLRWKEDSTNLLKQAGDDFFLVNDTTLPLEAELVTSIFANSEETIHFNEQVKCLQLYTHEGGIQVADFEMRYFNPILRTANIRLTADSYYTDKTTFYTGTMDGLSWTEFISSNYGSLVNIILARTKLLKAFFDLKAYDISSLDLSKPVYIRKYGRFFIINKVTNYLPGKTTEVELIRM